MLFREALKTGVYDFHKARDAYRSFVAEEGMHRDLAIRFTEVRPPPQHPGPAAAKECMQPCPCGS
jgi:hypothetical protein